MVANSIKRLPAWQIVSRLRKRGITQHDIAERAQVSQPLVSAVIRRVASASNKTEAVWRELERVLVGERAS